MARYRKKPVVIDATQWFKNGDHPEDACEWIASASDPDNVFATEGKVVRYFRRPDVSGGTICRECSGRMHDHGWIDTKEGGHIVCPGDWVITGIARERYPCKTDIFAATYEAVDG